MSWVTSPPPVLQSWCSFTHSCHSSSVFQATRVVICHLFNLSICSHGESPSPGNVPHWPAGGKGCHRWTLAGTFQKRGRQRGRRSVRGAGMTDTNARNGKESGPTSGTAQALRGLWPAETVTIRGTGGLPRQHPTPQVSMNSNLVTGSQGKQEGLPVGDKVGHAPAAGHPRSPAIPQGMTC